jgi:hypothetical protein
VVILGGLWGLLALPASGHVFAPSLLEVREIEAGHAVVRWKQPLARVAGSKLVPVLPPRCRGTTQPKTYREGTGMVARWELECAGGLVGSQIGVEGLARSKTDVLLRLALADGRSMRHVLTAGRPAFVVPEREGRLDVMAGYGRLGVEHILSGFDHLAFVLGLVLLVRGGRKLLWTITAFTLGHSVTLALAILGIVNVPQRPIDAGIAFSIYVLAVELPRRDRAKPGLMQRVPWGMAGLFGLLHGIGFAGALTEVGLPAGEIPLALFSFNVGIELGQLAFIGVVLAGWRALRPTLVHWPARSVYVPAYAMGSLAAFWFFERVAAPFL